MKLIRAIVAPAKIDAVKRAAWEAGVRGITVTDVRGFGYERSAVLGKRGEYAVELTPRAQAEMVVADGDVAAVVEAVQKAAWTGRIGDGKIFILPVADAVRVRTGEQGEPAI